MAKKCDWRRFEVSDCTIAQDRSKHLSPRDSGRATTKPLHRAEHGESAWVIFPVIFRGRLYDNCTMDPANRHFMPLRHLLESAT